MLETPSQSRRRRPLTVWELPDLLIPVHRLRKTAACKRPIDRPHYCAILAFIFRSRFVVSSQVKRRFPQFLKSDRTARRHLEEMEALGYLGVAPARGVGPLFPKVFFVTGRGLRELRQALARRGKSLDTRRGDRPGHYSAEGYTSEHILHEVLTTEFLLQLHLESIQRDDLELLSTERRSLPRNPAFQVCVGGKTQQLIPDAMFCLRQRGTGMICCLLEMDLGTMNSGQLQAKFRRFDAWAKSEVGQDFLMSTYTQYGAAQARPEFRLLVVTETRAGNCKSG